jgi:hypothetical protein
MLSRTRSDHMSSRASFRQAFKTALLLYICRSHVPSSGCLTWTQVQHSRNISFTKKHISIHTQVFMCHLCQYVSSDGTGGSSTEALLRAALGVVQWMWTTSVPPRHVASPPGSANSIAWLERSGATSRALSNVGPALTERQHCSCATRVSTHPDRLFYDLRHLPV